MPNKMTSRNMVSVIVHDKATAVLYSVRNWTPQPVWTLPGGKAEPGEALDEAAIRELKEETGLLTDTADLALIHVTHVELGLDQTGPFVLFVFATDTWTGDLAHREPPKHLEARWVPASRLPAPAFPTSTRALTAWRRRDLADAPAGAMPCQGLGPGPCVLGAILGVLGEVAGSHSGAQHPASRSRPVRSGRGLVISRRAEFRRPASRTDARHRSPG
ncbi:MAG TPA: NUDIX hydrolase [Streptomyces sp.]